MAITSYLLPAAALVSTVFGKFLYRAEHHL